MKCILLIVGEPRANRRRQRVRDEHDCRFGLHFEAGRHFAGTLRMSDARHFPEHVSGVLRAVALGSRSAIESRVDKAAHSEDLFWNLRVYLISTCL